jgi:hypothetical protein
MGLDTVPTGIITGVAGSLMSGPLVITVPAGGNVVLGPALATPTLPLGAGLYCITAMGANVTYQVFDGNAWQNIVAAGVAAPFIYSDGISFRFANAAGAPQNVTLQKIG